MKGFRFALVGTLLLGTLTVGTPVAAGDCWVAGVDAGDRFHAASNQELRVSLLQAEQVLRADSAANAIQGVRYQVHRSIDWEARHPGAPLAGTIQAYLHRPEAWAGKCALVGHADDIHFAALSVNLNALDFDSASLRPESGKALEAILAFHRGNPQQPIVIEGHTDDVGGRDYNVALSTRRARAVVDELVRRGAQAESLEFVGYGAAQPVDRNDSASGRAKNRRVTVRLRLSK